MCYTPRKNTFYEMNNPLLIRETEYVYYPNGRYTIQRKANIKQKKLSKNMFVSRSIKNVYKKLPYFISNQTLQEGLLKSRDDMDTIRITEKIQICKEYISVEMTISIPNNQHELECFDFIRTIEEYDNFGKSVVRDLDEHCQRWWKKENKLR